MGRDQSTSRHSSDDEASPVRGPAAAKRIGPKTLRIIGGELRRRGVRYNGDQATRPMKDSVRENLFNILGKAIAGSVAYDLFAGTGILAIEAISRGATHAIAIDNSRDCVRSIRKSADALGIGDQLEVLIGDAFRLAPLRLTHAAGERRTVFCCPPYALWQSDSERLFDLLRTSVEGAARGSLIIAETDRHFDITTLPEAEWDIRTYGNTHLAILETD